MFMILKAAFSLLGLAALTIGGLIFVTGPQATGQIFVAVLHVVSPDVSPLVALTGADIDSEMRFYAVLWMAYGALALWVAQALPQRVVLLRLMLCLFLLGGVGRAISYFVVGPPHLLFVVLMWIEIVLPSALMLLSFANGRPRSLTAE